MGHEPIWLDSNLAGSQSEGEDLFYVLETFDNDCYRRLHGNSNKSYTYVYIVLMSLHVNGSTEGVHLYG